LYWFFHLFLKGYWRIMGCGFWKCVGTLSKLKMHCWKRVFTYQLSKICSSVVHDMASHAKHSFISSVSCHHAERISCKIPEPCKVQSVVSPPHAATAPFVPQTLPVSVALNLLLMSFSHALGNHSVTRTKDFLSRVDSLPTRTHNYAGSSAALNSNMHWGARCCIKKISIR